MKEEHKIKEQSIDELLELRQRVAELESETEPKPPKGEGELDRRTIGSSRTDRTLGEKERLLLAFRKITQTALSSLDLEQILDNFAEQIVSAGIFPSLMIALVDDQNQSVEVVRNLTYRVINGTVVPYFRPSDRKVIGTRYDLNDSNITARVAREGEMKVIEEWDDRFDRSFDRPEYRSGRASYFIPVSYGDQVLAVLATGSLIEEKEEIIHRIEVMRPLLNEVATALKHAKLHKTLTESEEFNFALFQYNPIITIIVDLEGKVIKSNLAAGRLGDKLPKTGEVMYKDYAETCEIDMHAELMECIRSGNIKRFPELKHGDNFMDITIAPFPKGAIITSQDVTERKILEEQLLQAQKMEAVGRLAGGIAHDFNNLLTAINGYSELAKTQVGKGSALYKYIKEIRRSGERAANLTRQLLAFSRRQLIKSQIIDLNSVILDMDKMLRRLIGEDIEIVILPGKDLGSVKADPGQIEQTIVNLVVNSRDAMPEGGKIIIKTAKVDFVEAYSSGYDSIEPGAYVMISVSDIGTGMSNEVKSHLFEPFFTTKDPGKGTGLGLATVYGIVKQNEGHIFVDSQEGKGTTFRIYLPYFDEVAESPLDWDEEGYLPRGDETVLLVEDEQSVREFIGTILEDHGYAVLKASNGSEALSVVGKYDGPIHLLLTDIVMPVMGGQQLSEILKASRPEIKVLYTSGYTDDSIIRQGIADFKTAFLQKPFTASPLIRKVREVLDRQP